MARLTLSLSAFIAVVFLSVPSAPAQGFGSVQVDYDDYARLFQRGQEPNLSPNDNGNERWRAQFRDNQWQDFAVGNEDREPMTAAQVLMGIYMVQHVDHRLTSHIETIVWDKTNLSASLAERITLNDIAAYLAQTETPVNIVKMGDKMVLHENDEVEPNENEFVSILMDEMAVLVGGVYRIARARAGTGMPPRAGRAEIQAVLNLFNHNESHRNWASTYRFMRVKFDALDSLADSFSPEDKRQKAFRYVVGVYESSDFHLGSLRRIHRYFRAAAEQGDPLAQYHLALFLKYLGDLIDLDEKEIAEYQKWLDQAGNADLSKRRVVEVREEFARGVTVLAERSRALDKERRVAALLQIENQKMDMLEIVIVGIVQRMAPKE